MHTKIQYVRQLIRIKKTHTFCINKHKCLVGTKKAPNFAASNRQRIEIMNRRKDNSQSAKKSNTMWQVQCKVITYVKGIKNERLKVIWTGRSKKDAYKVLTIIYNQRKSIGEARWYGEGAANVWVYNADMTLYSINCYNIVPLDVEQVINEQLIEIIDHSNDAPSTIYAAYDEGLLDAKMGMWDDLYGNSIRISNSQHDAYLLGQQDNGGDILKATHLTYNEIGL